MKKSEAIEFFGSVKALAEKLGCTQAAIYLWKEEVPRSRQLELEVLSGGKLKAWRPKVAA